MPDFSALHVAYSGLRAAQVGMDTASHNVANAATDGYTRQRVELAARNHYVGTIGQLGNGVDVSDITRLRDAFLDARARAAADGLGTLETRSELLDVVEVVFGEPDQGVTAELSGLWSAFENWSLDPADGATRLGVLDALDRVVDRVGDISRGLDAVEEEAVTGLRATIAEANGILHELADVNRALVEATGDPLSPNDLLDRRDLLVDRLVRLVGADVTAGDHGTVRVSVNGLALVSDVAVSELAVADDGTITHATGVEVDPGGEAAGYRSFLADDLPATRASLDGWTAELADALNLTHQANWRSETEAGGPLLAYDPARPAASLAVVIGDPAELAAAASPGPPFPTFDARGAEALAGLRTALAAAGGNDTIDGAYRAIVTDVAQATAATRTAVASQRSVHAAASLARESEHGVSIDEEMVSLLSFQRAYEAAARVITAVDEALDVLINRTGIVGR